MRHEHLSDDPMVTELLDELRSWGTGDAPVPSGALATLLDGADYLDPAPATPRRKNMLIAKLAGLGLAAKVALGTGVAAAAVTTAGATGVLPDAAQHGVATVVNAVSPLEIPDVPAKMEASVNAQIDPDVTIPDVTIPTLDLPGTGGVIGDDEAVGDDEAGFKNHGECVSEVARDSGLQGREHGQAVAAIAQSDCGKGGEAGAPTSTTTTTTTTTTVPDDGGGETAGEGTSGPGNSAGRGNSAGKGNGNNRP